MKIKLSKEDWLKHGLKALSNGGYETLKAERMANKLGVSRGSFYWHFKNVNVFHEELLGFWQQHSTSLVIEELDQSVMIKDRLQELLKRGFSVNTKLEREFRFWANQNDNVASIIHKIDSQRESYITKLLKLSGLSEQVAQSRARFIYWAYLGQMLSKDDSTLRTNLVEIRDITRLFLQRK